MDSVVGLSSKTVAVIAALAINPFAARSGQPFSWVGPASRLTSEPSLQAFRSVPRIIGSVRSSAHNRILSRAREVVFRP